MCAWGDAALCQQPLCSWCYGMFLLLEAPGALDGGGRDSVLDEIQWLPGASLQHFLLERMGSDGGQQASALQQ